MIDVKDYKTLVFDCDGVILNSNYVKSLAFYNACLPYGEKAANTLVDYHVANGGISRYKKFEYFLDCIVSRKEKGPDMESLLSAFSYEVRKGLMRCEIAGGLKELRAYTSGANWFVVSGGDQSELRDVFSRRGIDSLFDGGIYGSPATKSEILKKRSIGGGLQEPSLFLGDSRYDYLAASEMKMDFAFISGWTEFSDWEQYCDKNGIIAVESIAKLISSSHQ